MTGGHPGRSPGQQLRTAALAGLAFAVLYLLQGTGPDSSTAAAVAGYNLAHRSRLLASEVAVGLALLAFIPFLAALVPVIWRAGQQTLAFAVAISGGVFVAMGLCVQRRRDRLDRRSRQQPTPSRAGPRSAAGPHPDRLDDHRPGVASWWLFGSLAGEECVQARRERSLGALTL
jgi:hypothetical protein